MISLLHLTKTFLLSAFLYRKKTKQKPVRNDKTRDSLFPQNMDKEILFVLLHVLLSDNYVSFQTFFFVMKFILPFVRIRRQNVLCGVKTTKFRTENDKVVVCRHSFECNQTLFCLRTYMTHVFLQYTIIVGKRGKQAWYRRG